MKYNRKKHTLCIQRANNSMKSPIIGNLPIYLVHNNKKTVHLVTMLFSINRQLGFYFCHTYTSVLLKTLMASQLPMVPIQLQKNHAGKKSWQRLVYTAIIQTHFCVCYGHSHTTVLDHSWYSVELQEGSGVLDIIWILWLIFYSSFPLVIQCIRHAELSRVIPGNCAKQLPGKQSKHSGGDLLKVVKSKNGIVDHSDISDSTFMFLEAPYSIFSFCQF